jgi:predicted RNA-binding Zn ribbon-like protein
MLSPMEQVSPAAAPGRLELVRRFVNTRDIDRDTDAFETATALERWLHDADLLPGGNRVRAGDVDHAVEVREALRAMLLANHGTGSGGGRGPAAAPPEALQVLNGALRRAGQSVAFTADAGWTTEPTAGAADAALGRLLGVVVTAMADGTWPRLKVCANDTCRWAFYDRSRARSARWCQMGACGNRAKQRAWRTRHAES